MALPIRSVLISDAIDSLCVDLLKKHGISVTCKQKLPVNELLEEITKHDALIVRSDTKVTAQVLEAGKRLAVVGRAGTGVDNIDLVAASKQGVIVLNTPGGNSISACELTCALISSLARNVAAGCQSMKEGRWDRKLYSGHELQGKTLAIIGLGRIGREVAIRMQSYGMKTVGFDPIVSADEAASFNVEKMSLDQIWPIADYITVHVPLIPQTKNMVNEKVFGACKKGVRVINVARGGIIDEAALLDALKSGQCGGAGLDVFLEEPPKNPVTLEVIKHPSVVATPHLGASTGEAQVRVAVEIAEQIVALARPESSYTLTGVVNAPALAAALQPDNEPWFRLAEGLGRVAGRLLAGQPKSVVVTVEGGSFTNYHKLLLAPAAVGILSSLGKNATVVNALSNLESAGSALSSTHQAASSPSLSITATAAKTVTVSGIFGQNNQPVLTTINGAVFNSTDLVLNENLVLIEAAGPLNAALPAVARPENPSLNTNSPEALKDPKETENVDISAKLENVLNERDDRPETETKVVEETPAPVPQIPIGPSPGKPEILTPSIATSPNPPEKEEA